MDPSMESSMDSLKDPLMDPTNEKSDPSIGLLTDSSKNPSKDPLIDLLMVQVRSMQSLHFYETLRHIKIKLSLRIAS